MIHFTKSLLATLLTFTLVVATSLLCLAPTPSSALELVDITTIDDYHRFALGDEYHAALIFFYANWDVQAKELRQVYRDAADKMTHDHVSGLVMGMIDVGKHPEIARSTGVKGIPTLLLYQFGTTPRRYAGAYHKDYFTVESIIEFAQAESSTHRVKLGAIRDAKAEKERTHYDFPHPEPGKVVELNSRNFNRVIRDPTKTAFVMYYASWCDICKNTMPDVEKLAEYFKGDGYVVIARMEVDDNQDWLEQNGLNLEGVPTFYLYPRGRKDKQKGWSYIGDRDFESMSVYVNANNRKTEEDIDDFHRSIIKNQPSQKSLPEYMQGKVFTEKDAMPKEIFGEDGRPYGDDDHGGIKNTRPMQNIQEGRTKAMKTKAERQFEEQTEGMTPEELEAFKLRKMQQKSRIDQGGNPMGANGPLPSEMKGKID